MSLYLREKLQAGVLYVGRSGEDRALIKRYENVFNINILTPADFKGAGYTQFVTYKFPDRRDISPSFVAANIEELFKNHEHSVIGISDYCQLDPHAHESDSLYTEVFKKFISVESDCSRTYLQSAIKRRHLYLRKLFSQRFLVSIHVRRGDYLSHPEPRFLSANLSEALDQTKHLIISQRIQNASCYIASDDLDYCDTIISGAGVNIISRRNLPSFSDTEDSELEGILWDWSACSVANMMINSNSTFSSFAALLNNRARIFLRIDLNKKLVPYDPWHSPILLGY